MWIVFSVTVDSLIQWRSCVVTSLKGSLNGLKGWYHPLANANHKLDDSTGSMKTFGRAGKSVLSTTNGLQMLQTKKPFWILTTEIEVIFLNVRRRKKKKKTRKVSLLSEYDLVSNSLVWTGRSWKSSSERRQTLWVRVFRGRRIVS